ncbi:uncharacterized protein J3R85_002840 [Psidium guajava]|nr:uncharacterized protein J3R85_002840 [Psidium guajava]
MTTWWRGHRKQLVMNLDDDDLAERTRHGGMRSGSEQSWGMSRGEGAVELVFQLSGPRDDGELVEEGSFTVHEIVRMAQSEEA